MAWYNTGTIALTNGSATVTGSGTNFLVGAQIGEALYAPDGKLYEIQTINSATVITLASNYLGSTASGQNYQIIPTQSLVADLASDVTDLISDFANVRDYAGNGKFNDGAVGTPGITFTQDQDNGLYRIGSNNWALAAGGIKQVDLSATDVEINYAGVKKLATSASGIDVTGTGTFSGAVTVTGNLINFNTGAGNAPYIQHTGNQLDIRGGTGSTRFLNNAGSQSTVTIRDTGNVNGSGLDVTGTVTADGLVTQATANTYPDSAAQIKSLAGDISYITNVGGDFLISNSSLSDQFVLSSAGNVGIGTSSIDGTLHVHTASAGTVTASSQADDLVIENSAEGGMTIITPDDQSARIRFTSPSTTADVGGASIFYRQNINKMSMGTEVAGGILALKSGAGSEGLLLDASGNFIVGATSAFDSSSFCVDQSGFGQFRRDGTPLLVRRDGSFGDLISFEDDGASVGGIRTGNGTLDINTASSTSFTVLQNGAAKMEIAGVNGSLYLYAQATGAGNADLRYTTSDGKVTYDTSSRLVKDEIEEIPYGLNTVMALSPKRYIRTDSDNKLEVGFIADEVVEVVPELVGMMEKRFLTMNQEDTEMVAGSVEYNKMTAVLVKAIQEQQATIEALTARIAALES